MRTGSVEVVNQSGGNARGLPARVELLNVDGTVKWGKTAALYGDNYVELEDAETRDHSLTLVAQ